MEPNRRLILALDFGGTKLTAGLVDVTTGGVVSRVRRPTPVAEGAEGSLRVMLDAGREALRGGEPVGSPAGIGISFGGPVSPDRRSILRSMHVTGWENLALPEVVSSALGLPAVMENDANAAAVGEWAFGAARGARHALYVQISTGIGSGLILDGRLYRGQGLAGEFGHLAVLADGPLCACGKRGCLESVAAGWAIARDGREALVQAPAGSPLRLLAQDTPQAVSARLVVEAYRAGDAHARQIVSRAFTALGLCIANAINLLHPEVVVIGGGIAQAWDVLSDIVHAALAVDTLPHLLKDTRVSPWVLGDDVTLIGAAVLMNQELAPKP